MVKRAKTKVPTRVERYRELLRDVAKRLDCEDNDPRVEHVATLTLLREDIQARLLEGQRVEPGDVLKIDDALRSYMPAAGPQKIELTYVEGVKGYYKCKCCGGENLLNADEYQPLVKKSAPTQIDGHAVEVRPAT